MNVRLAITTVGTIGIANGSLWLWRERNRQSIAKVPVTIVTHIIDTSPGTVYEKRETHVSAGAQVAGIPLPKHAISHKHCPRYKHQPII